MVLINTKKLTLPLVVAAAGFIGVSGANLLSSLPTSAATASNSINTNNPADVKGNQDFSKGGHAANGKTETVLTGDDATKATNAAKAAVPGATVLRVETDAEGAAYEAHMKKSDGSFATIKLDSNFKVTSTEDGFGPGPSGQGSTHQ
jgi:hypothetical protein